VYGYHLWFIGFLLVYALVSVPLLRRMRPETWPIRPSAIWLVLVPVAAIAVIQVPLRIAFPAYRDWADFSLWLAYFLAGAILLAWPGAIDAITRLGPRTLAGGLLLAGALVPIFLAGDGWALESGPRLDAASIGYVVLRTAVGWLLVLASIAIGTRWLDRGAEPARAASGLVLPFYVLHHPIVVAVAALAVPLSWPMWPTFGVIVVVSGAATAAACLAAARTRPLRVLLGMDGRARAVPATVTS
jgi:surface polysaccharide O-acyltransferase-like enzyme